MGRKTKVGKQRQDKFYYLAKETGFRSRAAFKLIQLNRRYEFLQKSRVLIDLCAAPGGWLQVAAKDMPISSVIVGVDLVPIKPIPNIITIQEDITTSKCKQLIKNALQTWKADVVLNDGAPNVGANWVYDAYAQAQLTLSALKLAVEFLRKGGWFITKIFRSKDYNSLLWVFRQLFKKVYATKPQASRLESAEIFVVCYHYLAPDKIDPKFTDPKYVFADDIEVDRKDKLGRNETKKARALGYDDGQHVLFRSTKIGDFVTTDNYIRMLNESSEFVIDDERFLNHRLTTDEFKENCKDLRVLGRKELKMLIKWRKHMRAELQLDTKDKAEAEIIEDEAEQDSAAEEEAIQKQVEDLQVVQMQELKRKKKKVLTQRRKLREKMQLKMEIPGDQIVEDDGDGIFKLSALKSADQLKDVNVEELDPLYKDDEDDDAGLSLPKYVKYDIETPAHDDYGRSDSEDDDRSEVSSLGSMEELSGNDDMEDVNDGLDENGDGHPLITDLDYDPPEKKHTKNTALWFSKEEFAGLESDEDADLEVNKAKQYYKLKAVTINEEQKEDEDKDRDDLDELEIQKRLAAYHSSSSDSEDSNFDANEFPSEVGDAQPQKKDKITAALERAKRKKMTLDAEGLALGGLMIQSKKTKRDITNLAWNRNTFNDENLPSWFLKDEEKHRKKTLPVTKEMVEEYKNKLKEINARPIKKIAEAKSRKKRRILKRMEKAKKKADAVIESMEISEPEKQDKLKTIYKKAAAANKAKKDVKYIVARKGISQKQRPASGAKGRYKLVDPRLKKDDRKRKITERQQKKKGKRGKKSRAQKKNAAKQSKRKFTKKM